MVWIILSTAHYGLGGVGSVNWWVWFGCVRVPANRFNTGNKFWCFWLQQLITVSRVSVMARTTPPAVLASVSTHTPDSGVSSKVRYLLNVVTIRAVFARGSEI